MSNGSLTLLQRTRLIWCCAGGPATSDARSPWFNDAVHSIELLAVAQSCTALME